MKRIAMFVVFTMLLSAAVAFAGPLTGVPTISYTDESGTTVQSEKDSGFAVGLGFSSFTYKLDIPAAAGGGSFDSTVTGPMLTAEYFKLMPDSDAVISAGAWWATVDGGDADLGNVYGRYRFNRNWGVELGAMFSDASKLWGEVSAYVTYEPTLAPTSNVGLQFGLGTMTKTDNWMDIGGVTVKTKFSVYGNASWALRENWTANLGLWLLSQQFDLAGFGKIADSDTLQWTIGAGYKF